MGLVKSNTTVYSSTETKFRPRYLEEGCVPWLIKKLLASGYKQCAPDDYVWDDSEFPAIGSVNDPKNTYYNRLGAIDVPILFVTPDLSGQIMLNGMGDEIKFQVTHRESIPHPSSKSEAQTWAVDIWTANPCHSSTQIIHKKYTFTR
jgi:hypothetical protein